jgi:hypothetical protein
VGSGSARAPDPTGPKTDGRKVPISLAPACDDPPMVEYGNGVSGVAGQVGGGAGAGGQSVDVGASVGQFFTSSVQTLSTMPPAYLLVGFAIVVLGLIMLRRAF